MDRVDEAIEYFRKTKWPLAGEAMDNVNTLVSEVQKLRKQMAVNCLAMFEAGQVAGEFLSKIDKHKAQLEAVYRYGFRDGAGEACKFVKETLAESEDRKWEEFKKILDSK